MHLNFFSEFTAHPKAKPLFYDISLFTPANANFSLSVWDISCWKNSTELKILSFVNDSIGQVLTSAFRLCLFGSWFSVKDLRFITLNVDFISLIEPITEGAVHFGYLRNFSIGMNGWYFHLEHMFWKYQADSEALWPGCFLSLNHFAFSSES